MVWHIQQNDSAKGPYSDDQLKALWDAGAVTAQTFVWKQGYEEWRPLADTGFIQTAIAPPPPFQRTARTPATATAGTARSGTAGSGTGPGPGNVFVDDLSMWQFFTRAVSQRYAAFDGRARRKEYWSFALFYLVFMLAAVILGASIDAAAGNVGSGSAQPRAIFTILAAILYVLAMLIPSLSLLVRRIHDIGMSGWFALLMFVPYIGGLIALIFTLIPTQMRANDHGPAPVAVIPH